ncbi:MAG: Holliday junction resolvase [Flavisolibacter sp.]|nr:Holliday junction resolvase [Flavisolibacter sp.]
MFSAELLAGVFALLLFLVLVLLFQQYKQKRDMELELVRQKASFSELEIKVHELAAQKFEEFKNSVLFAEQERIIAEQKVVAEASFERWKIEYETVIRQDAIKKSQAVTIGKVTEHIIPYFSGIFPYNPKEARFIGSPIDLIFFDCMEAEPENITVHFIEVKTASSSLTPKQRAIKYAILNKRVEWKELRV